MKRVCCVIAAFLVVIKVLADDPLSVRYLGIEHGLSNNAVTCIYRDHNGFMWFGTYDGLNKYDGYSFKVYRNIIGDSTSLNDNHIYTICDDSRNRIWIGTTKGISIFNPITSSFAPARFRALNSAGIQNLNEEVGIIEQVKETVFAGTRNSGLLAFDKNELIGQQITIRNHHGNYVVTAIEYDAVHNELWVLANGIGLCKYDFLKKELVIVNPLIKQASRIREKDRDNLWIVTDNGLFNYNLKIRTLSANYIEADIRVTDIIKDHAGTWWISSDGAGLWLLPGNETRARHYSSTEAVINSNAIYALYEDAEKRKWIGTLRGGVNILEPRTSSFKKISYEKSRENAVSNFILSFCEDEKSNIWIGTDGAGLRYWNRDANTYSAYVHGAGTNSLSSDFITCIARDYRDDIWISTWFGAINKFDKASNTFRHYTCYNPVTGQLENNTWFIFQDSRKRLWAGATNNGCLYLYNRAADKFELFDSSLINLQCIAEDEEGNLWGGTYGTLILIDTSKKKHQLYRIGYPVRSIQKGVPGKLWIGTEGGGLLMFDKMAGTYQRFTTEDGLPSNAILRILLDKKGNLWLSTFNGLCRFNPVTKSFKNFSQSDGLQSNQFSFNAALSLTSGEFAFGGIKGFNIFYPDSVYDKKNIPPLYLTGLRINNRAIEEDGNKYVTRIDVDKITAVTVPFDKGVLSIDFTAIEYSGSDKMHYSYYLKGWDKDWNSANNIRTANYSRLQEGSYTFYVKVRNADGVWGKETALLTIKVLPPWYRTWWAYLMYGIAFAGLIYLYHLYNKRQARLRYEVKLALLDKEKEKELTEKKIAFFTHISHEFRTPLTLIINPLKELLTESAPAGVHKKVKLVQRNAKRLLSLVDQLLLFRKVESIDQQLRLEKFDLKDACNEVFLSFTQLTSSKNIQFYFVTPENEITVYGDKEKIEIILFNLLSNAIKYTPTGGRASLAVRETETTYEIVVEDSGAGIPGEAGNKLFESFYQANNTDSASQTGFGIGLYVSQKLAKVHFGNLSYTSRLGVGTTFILTLLKGKAHFASQPISEEHAMGNGIVQELVDDLEVMPADEEVAAGNKSKVIDKLTSGLPTMMVVDDNAELRSYISGIFARQFNIYEADDGEPAYEIIQKEMPDIIISDVKMKRMNGIELCRKIKENSALAHIPVILLTASASEESKLKGIEGGAEDYINKPFDKEIILARVQNILKGRDRLRKFFFNTVTLRPTAGTDGEHKEFIDRCIEIVEKHLDNAEFTVQVFCKEIGMSHPSLYKKIKAVSGLTVNVFIRYLRLRKAAELLINTNKTIVEVTYITGFNDIKYFREQFCKLFEMNPSDYVKKYRKSFSNKLGSLPGGD